MKENNNSDLFYNLYESNSHEHKSFNSEKIYDEDSQNLSSGNYIIINIYKI